MSNNKQIAMHLRAAMILRGLRSSDIARACGVNRSTVSNVIAGRRRSSKVESYILQVLQ